MNYEYKIQSSRIPTPMAILANPSLERRLKAAVKGEVFCDPWSRGRYATDASIYQIVPEAVVVPESFEDVASVIEIAREDGASVLPRGGGTSQCGQTVNSAIVVDTTKHLNALVAFDAEAQTCTVEPGMVLDELNRRLKPHGLWYPIDVSTSSRATLGGMAGNNSCGGRSIRYGMMRDNVIAIDALLADGSEARFGPLDNAPAVNGASSANGSGGPLHDLTRDLLALGAREATEIAARFPNVMRRVGGYNIDCLTPANAPVNLAQLLVGSEGTLAFSRRLDLKLSPLPANKVMGVCHFPTFYSAMASTQEIVKLKPTAVELIDRNMISLARDIAMFRPIVERFVRGSPNALLVVEFAEPDQSENLSRLKQLGELMGDLGFDWQAAPGNCGGVVEAVEPAFQAQITEVRKSGLNIMMSMKSEGKPVSFVEDCAVELEDLAEFTAGLIEIFEKNGTHGTWYAHASVGCLHVRPVLNLKLDQDVKLMRAIAEEAFELVAKYKGSHSGEHGDGIVRSEFNEVMFGARMMANFREVKQRFDPKGVFNPGKIVDAPKMDDRSLFRFKPGYAVRDLKTELDWSAWPGGCGGFQGAVEMCNNNGACRKRTGGAMCPSFRVTGNERDLTRGRANSLRLAISGQLGPDALTSDDMARTMELCVGCKACKRECPTGVDMARMKIEVAAARAKNNGLSLRDRLIAWMPRYAPYAARASWLANLRNATPGIPRLTEGLTGFSMHRKLPSWRADFYKGVAARSHAEATRAPVILFADTFNTYFEPENLRAAERVLTAAGYKVITPSVPSGDRPPCCGRTFLTSGLVDQARREAERLIAAYAPHVRAGAKIVGLEPSCLLSLRDELPGFMANDDARAVAGAAMMLEEFLATEMPDIAFRSLPRKAHLHGHCHQKALNVMGPVETVLRMIPGLEVQPIESSCCGMAGAFGYGRDTFEVSMAMGELSLLPAVRSAAQDDLIVADGFSCRHQIADGTGRSARHVARILDEALAADDGVAAGGEPKK